MARATAIYTNFTGGQISDSMDGRVDTTIYQNGAKQLENLLVTQQGSAKRRQGLRFVNEAKDSTKAVRLIPFEFSVDQTYILEFGEEYIRFYTDQGVILDGGVPYEISTPYAESDLFNIRFVQNKDLLYLVDGVNPIKLLSRYGDTTWTLIDFELENEPLTTLTVLEGGVELIENGTFDVNILGWDVVGTASWVSTNGGSILMLVAAEISQEISIFEITKPHILQITNITLSSFTVQLGTTAGGDDILTATAVSKETKTINIPPPGVDTIYITCTSTSSSIIDNISLKSISSTLTLLSSIGYTKGKEMTLISTGDDEMFSADHVGSVFNLVDDTAPTSTDSARVRVVAFTDGANVQVIALENIPSSLQNNPTNRWQESAFSAVQGYPKIIAFFEQRLIFANTTQSPQTIWFSVSGIYNDFDTGSQLPADAFERQIASSKLNGIQWISEAKDVLVIGTTGGEFIMTGGGDNDGFTPSNVMIRKHKNYGSAFVEPVDAEGSILFAQRNAQILRLFGYSLEQDGYSGDDATIYADDILGTGIKQMAYQSKRSRAIWCVLNDGDIANLTYEPTQQIRAWSKQTTDGDFESVAVISGADADEVWVVVNRNIDGVDLRYIEYFEPETNDNFMVDSGLEYSGVSTSTVSGLDHLEGETVDVVNGGVAETQKVVVSGEITLDNPTTSALVGLPYISDLRTRRAEVASQNGPAQGKPKTIYKSIIRFSKTLGGKYSVDGDNFYDLELGDTEFSRDKEIMMPNGWDRYGDMYIRQDSPYPMNIQLIHLMVNTNDL